MFQASDFIAPTIHERMVVLGDGAEHAVFFRELPATEFKRYFMWQNSPDEDVRAGAEARLVARGVCGPGGEDVLTVEQAARLKLAVLGNLVRALMDVNGGGEGDLGNGSSPGPSSGSGTS